MIIVYREKNSRSSKQCNSPIAKVAFARALRAGWFSSPLCSDRGAWTLEVGTVRQSWTSPLPAHFCLLLCSEFFCPLCSSFPLCLPKSTPPPITMWPTNSINYSRKKLWRVRYQLCLTMFPELMFIILKTGDFFL